jgi:hypothetical protein
MSPTRLTVFSTLILLLLCGSGVAQKPGPEFWRKVSCEPLEPRTKLEALDYRQGAVIVRGFTRITTVEVRGVRIDAVEMRELGNTTSARGVVISLREGGEHPNENRAFIDYEELDSLLNAIDVMARVDETMTKFPGFEARYRTRGDLEITVFRQTRSLTAVLLSTGLCDRATQSLTLDDLARVKAMIQEAKERLDDIK